MRAGSGGTHSRPRCVASSSRPGSGPAPHGSRGVHDIPGRRTCQDFDQFALQPQARRGHAPRGPGSTADGETSADGYRRGDGEARGRATTAAVVTWPGTPAVFRQALPAGEHGAAGAETHVVVPLVSRCITPGSFARQPPRCRLRDGSRCSTDAHAFAGGRKLGSSSAQELRPTATDPSASTHHRGSRSDVRR
jgi:hypothetical protein